MDDHDRMDIHELGEGDYRAIWRLLVGCSIVLVICGGLLLAVVSQVAADEHPLCAYFEALSHEPGVRVAEWIGYPEGWANMPKEWDYMPAITRLPGGAFIVTYIRGDERWLWGFRSDEASINADGKDDGYHDFCPHVLIIQDNEQ